MKNKEYTKQCSEAYQDTVKAMKPLMENKDIAQWYNKDGFNALKTIKPLRVSQLFNDNEINILENLIRHEVTFFEKNKALGFDSELCNHLQLLDKITSLRSGKEN